MHCLQPCIPVPHPHLDVVVIRENEEDLYAGIEHRQTDKVFQCLKLITRPGSEKIVCFPFEYALRRNRRRVTCFVKDNLMKLTDGLFRTVFHEVAEEYPDLKADSMIVGISMARLASAPELFDVIVVPNLYGDTLSDIAAELSGSVGLASSANIGDHYAMFEAIRGSAPDIAGIDVANPSALLLSAVKMLAHTGQGEIAERTRNAWTVTIEDGIHTADIYREGVSQRRVATRGFAGAVSHRLGQYPSGLRKMFYASEPMPEIVPSRRSKATKDLVGVDAFLHESEFGPEDMAALLKSCETEALRLILITNRGVKAWPDGFPETLPHRPLALPLLRARGGALGEPRRRLRASLPTPRERRGFHQDGASLHLRRCPRVLHGARAVEARPGLADAER